MIDPDKITVQDEISFATVKQHGPRAVDQFLKLINNGETAKMAEMLVTRTPPRLGITDHTYQKNRVPLIDQFFGSHTVMNHWKSEYRRLNGEELPDDAVVLRSLAAFPGDRRAVISHKTSLADVQRAARERNLKVEGDWEMEPAPVPPVVQQIRMGEDLIANYAREYIREDPSLAEEDPREIREMVIHNHSRKMTADDLTPEGATTFKELADKLFRK